MGIHRVTPYSQFNFRVSLAASGASPGDFNAGFQEVTGLGIETKVAEYRAAISKNTTPAKITGTFKISNVTLKRGLVGDPATLYAWLDAVRSGGQGRTRTVIIQLMNEQWQKPLRQWTLINAWPTRFLGPPLTGKTADVAIQELVLVTERIDLG